MLRDVSIYRTRLTRRDETIQYGKRGSEVKGGSYR